MTTRFLTRPTGREELPSVNRGPWRRGVLQQRVRSCFVCQPKTSIRHPSDTSTMGGDPWARGCGGHSILREEVSYSSSEKKKEPFRQACGCRYFTKDGLCLAEGIVGKVQRVEGEWKMGSDRGQAEPWGWG